MEFNLKLTESQLEQLLTCVDVSGYVQYMSMDEWDEYMDGTPATEIIDIISGSFYTGDAFAYMDGGGLWNSADDLEEILEPYIEDIFNDYLHFYL